MRLGFYMGYAPPGTSPLEPIAMAQEAGRDPASLEVTLMGPPSDVDKLKRLAGIGVHRVVAMLTSESPDKAMAGVDRWANIMRQVNG